MDCCSTHQKKIIIVAEGSQTNKSTATNLNKLISELNAVAQVTYVFSYCNPSDLVGAINLKSISDSSQGGIRKFISNQIQLPIKLFSKSVRNNCDIILFAFGEDLQLSSMILYAILGKTVLIRSDGRPSKAIMYYKPKSRLLKYLFKAIETISYGVCDRILTECDYMIKVNQFPPQSGVLKLYTDTQLFNNRFPTLQRKYDIGYIGRFEPEKGILLLLDALLLLPPTFNILIIGDGSQKKEVMEKVEHLTQREYSIHFEDWVRNDCLPDYLNGLKMLVMPSNKEGLPNTLLEAMSCGVVPIATSVGGIPNIITHHNGHLLSNNSPKTLACAIDYALSNQQLLSTMSINASNYVEENYSFSVVVDEIKTLTH
jgi:glycosyltransferase involved in cell wall biosynthesis